VAVLCMIRIISCPGLTQWPSKLSLFAHTKVPTMDTVTAAGEEERLPTEEELFEVQQRCDRTSQVQGIVFYPPSRKGLQSCLQVDAGLDPFTAVLRYSFSDQLHQRLAYIKVTALYVHKLGVQRSEGASVLSRCYVDCVHVQGIAAVASTADESQLQQLSETLASLVEDESEDVVMAALGQLKLFGKFRHRITVWSFAGCLSRCSVARMQAVRHPPCATQLTTAS
jgi:hypothetical protein